MRLLVCVRQVLIIPILIYSACALPQESNVTCLFRAETKLLTLLIAPNDIIRNNDYIIQHCSRLGPQVQKALESLYEVLLPAIWETHYGTTSAPYKAFFKNSYYEMVVEGILRSASIGEPLFLNTNDKETLVPRLVCALKPDTVIAHEGGQDHDIYEICMENPTWTVMYYPRTSSILICPLFFLMPTEPAVGNCPTVNNATNELEGNFAAFWESQMYILLHEIAHFYIGATVEDSVDEVMDWNYAFSLSPFNATCNALNYVLFVASK